MSLGNKIKGAASGVASLVAKIKGAIKFFMTPVGHVLLYVIAGLLMALLIYIILAVLATDIGKLVGVEAAAAQTDKDSYNFLTDLTNSGYDSMLNAEELVDFYAFEYAVLMDAARFMEETGTQELIPRTISDVDCDVLSPEQWALQVLNGNSFEGDWKSNEESIEKELGIDIPDAKETTKKEREKRKSGDKSGDKEEFIDLDKFSTEATKDELFYYPVYNEYTEEYSLIPYLELEGKWDKLTFYMELGPDAKGKEFEIDSTFNKWLIGLKQRFNGGEYKGNDITPAEMYEFIKRVKLATVVRELNASNWAAFSRQDAVWGTGPEVVDLYKDYEKSGYYQNIQTPTQYKIPLRVLLDRFLPNATLMSSWRMLSEDGENGTVGDDVVNEIKEIYSQICLSGEKVPSGEKLLVKDVYKINAEIDENTDAQKLFDKTVIQQEAKFEYLHSGDSNSGDTVLLYGSYHPKFDSRPLDPTWSGDSSGDSQTFSGDFADDVIDDVALILKHFADDNNVEIKKESYDTILKDALEQMKPDKSTPNSEQQTIVYMPLLVGGYQTKCIGLTDRKKPNDAIVREHYNVPMTEPTSIIYESGDSNKRIIKPHVDSGTYPDTGNPYSNTPYGDCFVPLLKIAYSLENGLRRTVVIICYNGSYQAYIVKGKEIDDYAKISNISTFAFFETFYAKATTFGHWETPGADGNSKEGWAVTDAFEGMSIEYEKLSYRISYKEDGVEKSIYTNNRLREREVDELFTEAIYNVLAREGKEDALFPAGMYSIIRQNDDPTDRNYSPEMLALPTNATPEDTSLGGCSIVAGVGPGQTKESEKIFISLKGLGLKEGAPWPADLIGEIRSEFISLLYSNSGLDTDSMIRLIKSRENPNYTGGVTDEDREKYTDIHTYVTVDMVHPEFAVVFPVKRMIIPITQGVVDRGVRFYMVKAAKLWSSEKHFINDLVIQGTYKEKDRDDQRFLIPGNSNAQGLKEYNTSKKINWRCNLFAPIFAGEDDEATTARESDVLLLLSEWEEASSQGIHAADHFIRDLYALINYSKGIEYDTEEVNYIETDFDYVDAEENVAKPGTPDEPEVPEEPKEPDLDEGEYSNYVIPPVCRPDGETPYIHPGSYEFLYIPSEILEFDDTTSEKAFWLERLITTPDDMIDEATENYLRSQAPTFTWQVVDYELYEECQNVDSEGKPTGTARVYALWPFGSQFSRSLYVFAANASDDENERIMKTDAKPGEFQGWGGYFSCHRAADWYGRSLSNKIYKEVFGNTENAAIKSTYSNGKVTLTNVDSVKGEYLDLSHNVNGADVDLFGTAGEGLYEDDTPVTLILGGNKYTFSGTAAAVYGYELYRQTLITKSPAEAESMIREQLKKEIKWTEIRAVAPGIVTRVTGDSVSGFAVTIRHADSNTSEGKEGPNVTTSYCHMKRFPLVQKGQYVGAGTLLGYEGTTGKSNGYHLHTGYNINSTPDNPTYYNYPFFTPFFYAEKAEEVGYALDSEYMSIERTIFPYGQVSGVTNPIEYNTLPTNDDGTLKIQNYVPFKALLEDTKYILDENSGFIGYKDYSKLQTKDIENTLGGVNYTGDILKTNPQYFDKGFIAGVCKNNNKIAGAKPSKPIMLSEDVEGGLLPGGGWQYVWSYTPMKDKPILNKSVALSESEFQEFEAELERQVNIAGKGTRGAAVTAARYLAGFPYVVPYLGAKSYENNVGAYPHIGLNRTWGKRLAGTTNGFDCGAFVNWVMVNSGIVDDGDPKYGGNNANSAPWGDTIADKRTYLLSETVKLEDGSTARAGDLAQPGDFYHTKNENYDPNNTGGAYVDANGNKIKTGLFTHIGIIVAVDDKYIYVAEELSCMSLGRYPKYSDKHYVTFCDNIYSGEGNYDKELYTENEIPLPLYFKEDY